MHVYNAASRLVAGSAPVFVPRAQCFGADDEITVRLNNRVPAEILRAQLISVQFACAREFRAGKSTSSEQCSSTFEIKKSSRLLT